MATFSRNRTNSTAAVPSYVPAEYRSWVLTAARGTGLPVNVVAAQIDYESGFQPGVTSSAGAEGIAQFEPGTYAEYGSGNPYSAPYNPADALPAYIALMSANLKEYHGNIADALAAYNAGTADSTAGQAYAAHILGQAGSGSTATTAVATTGSGVTSTYSLTRPGGQSTQGTGVGQIFADYQTSLLSGVPVIGSIYNDITGGITDATDFFKFIAFIFNPLNILRMVEFQVGLVIMLLGIFFTAGRGSRRVIGIVRQASNLAK